MNAPQSLVKSRRDRFLKTCGGFALLTVGVPMLFLPGPGAPAIVLGLTLLGGEYPWAHKALSQIERPTQWLRSTLQPSWQWAKSRLAGASRLGSSVQRPAAPAEQTAQVRRPAAAPTRSAAGVPQP